MRGIAPAGADRWRAAAGWWLPVWPLASPQPGRHPSLLSRTCYPHTSGAFHTWICLHLFGTKLGSGVSLHLLAACEHLFCCLGWLIIKLECDYIKKKDAVFFCNVIFWRLENSCDWKSLRRQMWCDLCPVIGPHYMKATLINKMTKARKTGQVEITSQGGI